jgi:hypothetical protein
MISFQTFDQWHTLLGYLAFAAFFFFYPLANDNLLFKSLVIFGVIVMIFTPFLVQITPDEQNKMIFRSGKIVQIFSFVLMFYAFVKRDILIVTIPKFYWYCYGLAAYNFLELLCSDVLLSGKYQFVTIIFPFLQNQFGIQDFNFTGPFNYLIKFIFLGLFFRDLCKNRQEKYFFQYLIYVLVLFELVQVFVFKSYQGYDSLSSTLKNIFILGSTGLFTYKLYRTSSNGISLQKNPYFWITLGLMLPALAEIFLEFIFTKLYQTDLLSFYKLYLIRNASQISGFTLLVIGFWQAKFLRFLPKEY